MDGKLVANKEINGVEYAYNVKIDNNLTSKVNVKSPYTVAKLKEITGTNTVFFNNKELEDDVVLTSLKIKKNDVIQTFSGKYMIKETFY